MAARPFIVLGDQTDHGGVVIEASVMTDTHGKGIARVGDQVTCPKRGHGTTVIVTGDPTMIIDGKAAARHGDKCACGATLISSQVVSTVGDGHGAPHASIGASPYRAASAMVAEAAATSLERSEMVFDQHFQLVDEVSGQPLCGQKYRIAWPGGVINGQTGDDGLTEVVVWHSASGVTVELLA